jgi:hypothetical protein
MFSYFMCDYIGLEFINKYSYLICAYKILKFNNHFSLCFRIFCNSIYVERIKRQSNLPLFTCDYPDCSPLMGPLNPS